MQWGNDNFFSLVSFKFFYWWEKGKVGEKLVFSGFVTLILPQCLVLLWAIIRLMEVGGEGKWKWSWKLERNKRWLCYSLLKKEKKKRESIHLNL